MKKTLTILLMIAMLFAMGGCTGDPAQPPRRQGNPQPPDRNPRRPPPPRRRQPALWRPSLPGVSRPRPPLSPTLSQSRWPP